MNDETYERLKTIGQRVPSFHSPQNFSLEKYREKHKRDTERADMIGRGDFAALIRRNNERKV